jgi:peroxiredoxin family protein
MLAAILESGEPSRLYTALSLLVSTAADGEPARGLVSFGALAPMLADIDDGDDAFTRTLAELRRTAAELDDCRLFACAAAVETAGVERAEVERRLDGVMSTPRFLRETAGARLVVVRGARWPPPRSRRRCRAAGPHRRTCSRSAAAARTRTPT